MKLLYKIKTNSNERKMPPPIPFQKRKSLLHHVLARGLNMENSEEFRIFFIFLNKIVIKNKFSLSNPKKREEKEKKGKSEF
jgi:hypothetical protein